MKNPSEIESSDIFDKVLADSNRAIKEQISQKLRLDADIENAIRSTLVVENKIGIRYAVDELIKVFEKHQKY